MKNALFLTALLFTFNACTQNIDAPFAVELEAMEIVGSPGIQSYTYGITSDNKWVILGGRIDGLHQRQPFAAFLEQDNNKFIFVIDPVSEQVWSSPIDVLPTSMFEQLQSTNQQFQQRDTILYVTGGYGYSATADLHITYPHLTAISIDQLANAVITNDDITPYFRQITDNNFKLAGGQLGYLDSTFYLVGGHLFDGSYNPMGPTHGPGFTQIYSNEIRTFEIEDDGVNLTVLNYAAQHDTINLHRRDYNMAPQIFPDGTQGFTAFSGVFDYNDMPYLNTVDITDAGYAVNSSFNQYLSQYHSAKIPMYDTVNNVMHTFFFGGLSQFYMDANNNLWEDIDVPFVNTVSRVSRDTNGDMVEVKLDYLEMPTLVGSGAEFIPIKEYFYDNEVLNLESVPQTRTLIGYIYGGIESSAPNIFFSNDGTQSFASNVIFKVYINKGVAGIDEVYVDGSSVFNPKIYPNPAGRKLNYAFFAPTAGDVKIACIDEQGKIVIMENLQVTETGIQENKLNISELQAGTYFLVIDDGYKNAKLKFAKR